MDTGHSRNIDAPKAGVRRRVPGGRSREEETRRYRRLVDNATDLIFTVNMEGVFTFVNRASLALLGYAPEEMVGQPVTRFVASEYHALMALNREKKAAGVPATEYDLEAIRKDGSRCWLAVRTTIAARQGNIVETEGIARDITEARRVEQALRRSEERLLLLVRATNDAVWDHDLANNTIWWNEGLARFGYAMTDIRWDGAWWAERLHPDDRARIVAERARAVSSGGDYWSAEYRFLRGDGTYADVFDRGFVTRETGGKAIRMVGAMLDISLQKAAERAAKASAERFELLFENHPQPIFVFDAATMRVLEVNRAALAKYGYSREEFLNMSGADLHPPEEIPRFLQHLNSERAAQVFYSGQWRHKTRHGKILDVEVLRRKLDYAGRPARLVVVQDVTGRRALEHQLQHAQRMEAVGRLAGGVAHDFNNLLTVINGYCELLLARLPSGDPAIKPLIEIHKATQRASALTVQLLAFSRRQAIQPRRLDLNQVLEEMSPLLERLLSQDVELKFDLAPRGAPLSADPRQLEQIVMNLVVNARDAMPSGGRILVKTRNLDLEPGETGGPPGGACVELSVADTGHGMDEETLSHVFEPFFTTKGPGKGTGLGLSTVYGIVDQNGGFIDVESKPGQGTRFRIFFPRVPPGAARAGGESILLADPDAAARRAMAETLRRAGYRVSEASDSLAALDLAARESFDLLLVAVLLPGMSGPDLAARLERIRPSIRVVFLSAGAGEPPPPPARSLLQEPAGAGEPPPPPARSLLQKPVAGEDLLQHVRAALDA